MEIKKIEYEVAKSGITPATSQPAGVQGDDNATKLSFVFSKELLSELDDVRQKTGGRILYRFDSIDASGFTDKSDVEVLGNETKSVEFSITRKLTMFGGTAKVYLCLTLEKEDKTLSELFSFPAILYFSPRPGAEYEQSERESLSTLARIAKESSITAVSSMETAVEAKKQTEFARRSLEENTEFIFNGGDSTSEFQIGIVVDDELSEVSPNPVQNSLITQRINGIIDYFEGEIGRIESDAIENAVQEAKRSIYPVGSIYISVIETNPAEIFGGEWQQIEDKFLLACGNTYEAGREGGEAAHTLSINEIPQHTHLLRTQNNGIDFVVPSNNAYASGQGIAANGAGTTRSHWFKQSWLAGETGGGIPHNNMPPYLAVYIWKRTA